MTVAATVSTAGKSTARPDSSPSPAPATPPFPCSSRSPSAAPPFPEPISRRCPPASPSRGPNLSNGASDAHRRFTGAGKPQRDRGRGGGFRLGERCRADRGGNDPGQARLTRGASQTSPPRNSPTRPSAGKPRTRTATSSPISWNTLSASPRRLRAFRQSPPSTSSGYLALSVAKNPAATDITWSAQVADDFSTWQSAVTTV